MTDDTTKPTTKKTYKVGEIVDLEPGTVVTRPDGSIGTAGTGYALDVPGTFLLGDREVVAK